MDIVVTSIITFIFTIISTILIIPFLRKFFLDVPNKRSSHLSATPSGGGLGFIIASIAIGLKSSLILPLISLPLSLIGFFDDLINLSPIKRIFAQSLTLIVIYSTSPLPRILEGNGLSKTIFVPLIVLFGIYIINIINFADGLDGLLGGCMCVILLYYSINIDKSFFPIFTALLGFQFLNWAPAKVFMGDGGSTFLGALYVGLIYYSNSFDQTINLILLSFPLILDTSVCLLRRINARHNILKAHKLHLFQRLHQAGYSHSFISLIYISSVAVIAISLSFMGLETGLIISMLIFLIGVFLDRNVAVPFSK
tara:strand:- start:3847 stop:4776 length:930 start_codon:yes stop_codon:yes gene_type:complete